jgi:hypothetical protein
MEEAKPSENKLEAEIRRAYEANDLKLLVSKHCHEVRALRKEFAEYKKQYAERLERGYNGDYHWGAMIEKSDGTMYNVCSSLEKLTELVYQMGAFLDCSLKPKE